MQTTNPSHSPSATNQNSSPSSDLTPNNGTLNTNIVTDKQPTSPKPDSKAGNTTELTKSTNHTNQQCCTEQPHSGTEPRTTSTINDSTTIQRSHSEKSYTAASPEAQFPPGFEPEFKFSTKEPSPNKHKGRKSNRRRSPNVNPQSKKQPNHTGSIRVHHSAIPSSPTCFHQPTK
ncbi:hypothetical protein Salat_2768700 [Sesamum alatum]|uniref:Uncharacterized protein n=1 Tax=Sesamum alatum TaxID=300844 RepID=A0AAE1XKL8_9LAMI|nr:hypothetical protein Salat_2768700 [Sesamum alatum]